MNCLDCGKQIGPGRKSGRCLPCGNLFRGSDPEFQRRRAEGIRRKFQDPEHLEKMRAVARRNGQKASTDPEYRKRLIERGKRIYAEILSRPDVRKRNVAAIKASGWKITEHWLGWCPEEYRGLYRRLTLSKRMPAKAAREAVEKHIADDQAIRSGNLSDAVFWLNRIAPVSKLDDGRYRYGNAILSPGEIMARARLKGWTERQSA